jgi:hypothetical protein
MGMGVLARLPQRACLVSLQLLGDPVVALAQRVPAAQDTQDHSQVAAPQSVFILGVGKATRRPDVLWASGHDRLVVSWAVCRRWQYSSGSISPRASRSARTSSGLSRGC